MDRRVIGLGLKERSVFGELNAPLGFPALTPMADFHTTKWGISEWSLAKRPRMWRLAQGAHHTWRMAQRPQKWRSVQRHLTWRSAQGPGQMWRSAQIPQSWTLVQRPRQSWRSARGLVRCEDWPRDLRHEGRCRDIGPGNSSIVKVGPGIWSDVKVGLRP